VTCGQIPDAHGAATDGEVPARRVALVARVPLTLGYGGGPRDLDRGAGIPSGPEAKEGP